MLRVALLNQLSDVSKLRVKRLRAHAHSTETVKVRPFLSYRRGTCAVVMFSNWQVSKCRKVRSFHSLISARSRVSGSP